MELPVGLFLWTMRVFQPPGDDGLLTSLRKCADAILDLLRADAVEGVDTEFVLPSALGTGPDVPLIVMRARDIDGLMSRLSDLGPLDLYAEEGEKRGPAPGMRSFVKEGHTVADMAIPDKDESCIIIRCGGEILEAIARRAQSSVRATADGSAPAAQIA